MSHTEEYSIPRFLVIRAASPTGSLQQRLLAEAGLRIDATSGVTVLEMKGYRLGAEALDDLMALRRSGKVPSAPSSADEALRDWALGELMARRAVGLGLDEEAETATALRWRRRDLLAHRELVRRSDLRLREPGEEELRRHFEAHPERYRAPEAFELAVIHLADGGARDRRQSVADAVAVARQLDAGEISFGAAARRHSIHPSGETGGLIGWHDLRQISAWGPTVTKAVRQMSPGERTDLVRLESGLWIFELRDRRAVRPMTFDDAAGRVRQELRRRQIRQLEVTVRQEHLSQLGVEIHAPSSQRGSPPERSHPPEPRPDSSREGTGFA